MHYIEKNAISFGGGQRSYEVTCSSQTLKILLAVTSQGRRNDFSATMHVCYMESRNTMLCLVKVKGHEHLRLLQVQICKSWLHGGCIAIWNKWILLIVWVIGHLRSPEVKLWKCCHFDTLRYQNFHNWWMDDHIGPVHVHCRTASLENWPVKWIHRNYNGCNRTRNYASSSAGMEKPPSQ